MIESETGREEAYVDSPKGVAENPLTDEELFNKARRLGMDNDKISEIMSIEDIKLRDLVI